MCHGALGTDGMTWRGTMCHGALPTDGVTLERSTGPVKFLVLEVDGMAGEKYSVPFNLVT